jgi:hypothetical protein
VSLLEAQAYTSHESIAKAFGKPKSRITECVGFTRLPDETKHELLKTGVKNRSLLRHLLTVPPDQHAAMIKEATGKEEELPGTTVAAAEAPKTDRPKAEKKEPKPFEYALDTKGLAVPGFKWKAGEGNDKLQGYAESLRKLLEQIEERLTQPSA